MFRPLKNVYFLSLKSRAVCNGSKKWLNLRRAYFATYKPEVPDQYRNKLIDLLLKQRDCNDWDEIIRNAETVSHFSLHRSDVVILELCHQNKLNKQAMSFFKYLLKNYRLTKSTLLAFLSMVANYPEDYLPCRRLIYMLFMKYLEQDPILARKCAVALFHYPEHFDEVFKIYMENLHLFKDHIDVVKSLVSCNRVEEVLKLYLRLPGASSLAEPVLNAVMHELKKGRMPYKLTEVVKIMLQQLCDKDKFLKHISDVSTVLSLANKIDKDYLWLIHSFPSKETTCVSCNLDLKTPHVTVEEMTYLLDEFDKKIVSKNVFITSFKKHWDNYINFLDQIEYDAVIDGMNLIYLLDFNLIKLASIVDTIGKKKKNILILFRKHVKSSVLDADLPSTCLVHFLDNTQNDDIFIVYAALKRGPGCWVFTHDKYGFFKSGISYKAKEIYKKWEGSHVGKFVRQRVINPVGLTLGLHMENCSDPSEMKCHLVVHSIESYPVVTCGTRYVWLNHSKFGVVPGDEQEFCF